MGLGFEIEVFAQINTTDIKESKRLTGDFNYEINNIVGRIGVEFSQSFLIKDAEANNSL